MHRQRSSELSGALVAAGFLLLAAWGNALALLVASALALVLGWAFYRPHDARAAAFAALLGAVAAAVAIAIVKQLH